jgi:hypothetical protein
MSVSIQQPDAGRTPVYYANGLSVVSQVYDLQLDFTLQSSPQTPPVVVASVHLSPQLAKVVGRLLRQNVKNYQEQTGTIIELPEVLLKQLKLADLEE